MSHKLLKLYFLGVGVSFYQNLGHLFHVSSSSPQGKNDKLNKGLSHFFALNLITSNAFAWPLSLPSFYFNKKSFGSLEEISKL